MQSIDSHVLAVVVLWVSAFLVRHPLAVHLTSLLRRRVVKLGRSSSLCFARIHHVPITVVRNDPWRSHDGSDQTYEQVEGTESEDHCMDFGRHLRNLELLQIVPHVRNAPNGIVVANY